MTDLHSIIDDTRRSLAAAKPHSHRRIELEARLRYLTLQQLRGEIESDEVGLRRGLMLTLPIAAVVWSVVIVAVIYL